MACKTHIMKSWKWLIQWFSTFLNPRHACYVSEFSSTLIKSHCCTASDYISGSQAGWLLLPPSGTALPTSCTVRLGSSCGRSRCSCWSPSQSIQRAPPGNRHTGQFQLMVAARRFICMFLQAVAAAMQNWPVCSVSPELSDKPNASRNPQSTDGISQPKVCSMAGSASMSITHQIPSHLFNASVALFFKACTPIFHH